MQISDAAIQQLVAKIGAMKPATIKESNVKQLIKLNALFESPEYIAEDKIDGCHYLLVGCRFFSTDRVEKTDNYPHLRDFFIKLGMPNLILDGEINYPGKTSQYCTRVTGAEPTTAAAFQQSAGPIHYTLWDMLRTPKGTWLINKPLKERRKILEYWYEHYVKGTALEEYIHLTRFIGANKQAFKDEIIANGGEGIILKDLRSNYVMGKKPAWMWIKVKVSDTADLFIIGYDAPTVIYSGSNYDDWPYWATIDGAQRPVTKYHYNGWIGALRLGAYVDGEIHHVCTCSGIDEGLRAEISENHETFLNRVVKITYMENTEAGIPRHPRFEGFHESKTAVECEWKYEN